MYSSKNVYDFNLRSGVYFVRIEGAAYLHPQVNKLIKL
jgi:hypothetical protein